ncbi:RRP15-like protein [Hylaeus anthracinus]|uniref:RRP15-like protein n=1 Tax=Hylaeus volcanicus TaxID=313075 RepID=UPI0023B7D4BB|nr:RRP15-like protein [Hylaeus volcanicus]XP_054011073.1 RRP15-like protein [Hylaeus anthracinus]
MMIALDTTAKIGKSPKKPQVEIREDSDDNEQDSDEDAMESEEQELESADKGYRDTDSDDDESSTHKSEGNPNWADAMQKILRTKKPKRKKTIVLSKAKKLCDVKKEKSQDVSFEIEKVKEEIKTEEPEETKSKVQRPLTQLKERRKDNLGIRVKPSITDRERERVLQKIATKGVVQLFNAVRQQQGVINEKLSKAGPLERKREQVLKSIDKNSFLDILMGGSKSIQVDNDVKNESRENEKNKEEEKGVWSVLRDDFVMGTKLKDWDRKSDNEDSSAPEDIDSDN